MCDVEDKHRVIDNRNAEQSLMIVSDSTLRGRPQIWQAPSRCYVVVFFVARSKALPLFLCGSNVYRQPQDAAECSFLQARVFFCCLFSLAIRIQARKTVCDVEEKALFVCDVYRQCRDAAALGFLQERLHTSF